MHYERLVILILALFGVVIGTYISFRSGNYGYIFAFAAIPFAILLVGKARMLFMLVILAYNSELRIPFLPGNLELYHILALGLGFLLFMGRIINKEPNEFTPTMRYAIIGFFIVLLLTMGIRGTGFRMLGDNKWGGVRYLAIIIPLFMLFHSCAVKLTTRQWVITIIGMQLAAFLPFLAEVIFLTSKGAITEHYYFFKFGGSTGKNFGSFAMGDTHGRIQQGGAAATATLILAFILTPFKGKGKFVYGFACIIAFMLIGLSGHRIGYVVSAMFIFLYGFITAKNSRLPFMILCTTAAVALIVGTILFGHLLPYSYQRALSWVPFAELDRIAELHANSTTEWRLQVWKDALHEIPDYLWIGKGYSYDVHTIDALRLNRADYIRLWAPTAVSYHSGPLSFLIGLGIPGLLVGGLLLIYPIVRHLKLLRHPWENNWLYRIHLVITVRYVAMVAAFYLFYGDVYNSVPKLLIHIAILEGLLLTDKKIKAEKASENKDEDEMPSMPDPPRVTRLSA